MWHYFPYKKIKMYICKTVKSKYILWHYITVLLLLICDIRKGCIRMYKAISDRMKNRKIINCIVLSIILIFFRAPEDNLIYFTNQQFYMHVHYIYIYIYIILNYLIYAIKLLMGCVYHEIFNSSVKFVQ